MHMYKTRKVNLKDCILSYPASGTWAGRPPKASRKTAWDLKCWVLQARVYTQGFGL